jgi:membrane-associated phospholipid phosphatase
MPLILVVGGFIFGSLADAKYWVLVSVGIVAVMLISRGLKAVVPHDGLFLRPNADDENRKCSLTDRTGGKIGMPSEHAMVMSYFAAMVYFQTYQIDVKSASAVLLALMVILQRYVSGCHSILQLVVGALLGVGLAGATVYGAGYFSEGA